MDERDPDNLKLLHDAFGEGAIDGILPGDTFTIDGVEFVCKYVTGSTAERFYIVKTLPLVQRYREICERFAGGNIVELGIAEGGQHRPDRPRRASPPPGRRRPRARAVGGAEPSSSSIAGSPTPCTPTTASTSPTPRTSARSSTGASTASRSTSSSTTAATCTRPTRAPRSSACSRGCVQAGSSSSRTGTPIRSSGTRHANALLDPTAPHHEEMADAAAVDIDPRQVAEERRHRRRPDPPGDRARGGALARRPT